MNEYIIHIHGSITTKKELPKSLSHSVTNIFEHIKVQLFLSSIRIWHQDMHLRHLLDIAFSFQVLFQIRAILQLIPYISMIMSMHTHQGFQGAGGGGGFGNKGGTAENIVFLSIPTLLSPERATRAATKPAFPASVGSV